MRYTPITLLIALLLLASLTPVYPEATAKYNRLDTAVKAGIVRFSASYCDPFFVHVKAAKISHYVKGVRILPGLKFAKKGKASSRVAVKEVVIHLSVASSGEVVVPSIALGDGKFIGKFNEPYVSSELTRATDPYVLSLCKKLGKNPDFSSAAGQIALWLKNGNPDLAQLLKMRGLPPTKKLFSAADGARGAFLAQSLGVNIENKDIAGRMDALIAALKDTRRDIRDWGIARLNAKGFSGSRPVDVAESIWRKGDTASQMSAATVMAKHKRVEPFRNYILNRNNGMKERLKVLSLYNESAPDDKCSDLFNALLRDNYGSFIAEISLRVATMADTPARVNMIADFLRRAGSDSKFCAKCTTGRKRLARSLSSSKRKIAVEPMLELLGGDPDVSVRMILAHSLASRKEARALKVLGKCLEDPVVTKSKHLPWFKATYENLRNRLHGKPAGTLPPTPSSRPRISPSPNPSSSPSPTPTRSKSLLDRIREKKEKNEG